jgi:2,3,4,5-tetrahydropyridine-2-carboxylate N-succinyltransferase
MSDLQRIIDDAFERRDTITPTSVDPIVREAVLQTIDMLDAGQIRVAEKLAEGHG